MKNQARFAKKSLGQNFLTSTQVRDKILKEAGNLKGKNVLEIGPGLGFLTEKLLEAGANLTAVELDDRAVKILSKTFEHHKNFNLINGDILQQDLDQVFGTAPYCVIANIPYNITNPIIRKLLEKTKNKPQFSLIMVQKEVAQKICDPVAGNKNESHPEFSSGSPAANNKTLDQPENQINKILSIPLQGQANPKPQAPSKTQRSILSIAVEVYAHAEYCFTVYRDDFEPAPKVDSAIMRLNTLKEPLVTEAQCRDFFTVVNAGFSEKRKKIGNIIGKFFGIPSEKLLGQIDGNRRAETLSIQEWLKITQAFQKSRSIDKPT